MKTARSVHPNVGIWKAYQRQLDALVTEMHNSMVYWLKASYRANPPVMAQDASPASILDKAFQTHARRWLKRFDEEAPKFARRFAQSAKGYTDREVVKSLKDSGMTVTFNISKAGRDAYDSLIAENVGLIKRIASEHLADVQGLVMRSVQNGNDLKTLTDELEKRYDLSRNRAALIAKDQNKKATAVITRANQLDAGINEAIWVHSTAGNHPRPSHVEASGKKYKISQGMWIDGKYTFPGMEINCRCISKPVIPGFS